MVMADQVNNGTKTYSKTPFKEKKHPRGSGGTFKSNPYREEGRVSYHHDFSPSQHKRAKDGAFSNESNGVRQGRARYGTSQD